MKKRIAIILINYKDYAKKYLDECLASLREQESLHEVKLYIVDNASSEESFLYLQKKAPEAEIIVNINNDGFAKGNNDAMRIALLNAYDYVALFNMDTVLDKKALNELVVLIESDKDVAVVQSRLMLYSDKKKINSTGNATHFLGFGFCKDYNLVYKPADIADAQEIFYPSGAAMLMRADVLMRIGLFDEDYFMYSEDQDLGWRVWLAGFKCVLSKKSIVYHKYEFSRSVSKYFYMDRNRIITALKNYKKRTILVFLPAFTIMELGLFLFAIKNKWVKDKFKIWSLFFKYSFWKSIASKRRDVHRIRVVDDMKIVNMLESKISYQEIASPLLSLANIFMSIYFKIAKFVLSLMRV